MVRSVCRMSGRSISRSTAKRIARFLVGDIAAVASWRLVGHHSWGASLTVGAALLVLVGAGTARLVWLDRHPEKVAEIEARAAAKQG